MHDPTIATEGASAPTGPFNEIPGSEEPGSSVTAVPQSACDKLPQELLERIFILASEPRNKTDLLTASGWGSVRVPGVDALLSFSRVCKSWLSGARAVLYRNICIDNAPKLLYLYLLFKNENPNLGHYVGALDTAMLSSGNLARAHALLLDCLPNLTELKVLHGHCKYLSNHRIWNQISRLQLRLEGFGILRLPVTQADFPSRLTSLTLENSRFNGIQDWSSITLPSVNTLILNGCEWPWEDRLPFPDPKRRLSPHLPSLRRMTVLDIRSIPADQSHLTRIFAELGQTVETLHLQSTCWTKRFVTPHSLPQFPRLTRLKLEYNAPDNDAWLEPELAAGHPSHTPEEIRALFPLSLQYLDITWSGCVCFCMSFMSELAKPAFLPNLKRCPNLHYDVNFLGLEEHETVGRTAIAKELVTMAWNTALLIRQNRPNWPASNPLLINLTSMEELPLLPPPLEYMRAIPTLVADTVRELQAVDAA
ncbi:hypothetical protein P389DRAFT_202492 [Cystobasidium minutum MCA 4210]|uniref:uncharacterized protein n=1 Tax=Cystobasidium minutum MCA 4210 TaxID=1397322 RepID=UPI0034CF71B6|eukprot:jgi/Rhomi1/202492/MIX3321_36_88